MGWWKADAPAEPSSTSLAAPSSHPPASSLPTSNTEDSASSCPVDPKTRAIWLQQASSTQRSEPTKEPSLSRDGNREPPTTAASSTPLSTAQCSSDTISQSTDSPSSSSSSSSSSSPPPSSTTSANKNLRTLSHDRVISTIPRAFPEQPLSSPTSPSSPSNSERETGAHPSGNWIYPSEQQFFTAVLRKHNPQSLLLLSSGGGAATSSSPPTPTATASATDSLAHTIPAIIPIHNAVNERAWSLIQEWERPFAPKRNPSPKQPATPSSSPPIKNMNGHQPCSGPRLLSFRGLGSGPPPSGLLSDYLALLDPRTSLSPRARWNALRGYQTPFDRHDWVVQRCGGERVEYVIDFYQGRGEGEEGGARLSFYLDVRPKLNSWVGWRTRVAGWGGVMRGDGMG